MVLQGFNQGKESQEGAASHVTANMEKKSSFFGFAKKKARNMAMPMVSTGDDKDRLPIAPLTPDTPDTQRMSSRASLTENFEVDEEVEESSGNIFKWALGLTLAYMSLGILVFCLAQEWSFIWGLYFVVVTLTTVGYGDQEAWKSEGVMLFAALYALFGILLMGAALGIIAGELVKRNEKALKEAQSKMLNEEAFAGEVGKKASGVGDAMVGPFKRIYEKYTSDLVKQLVPSFITLTIMIALGMVFIWVDHTQVNSGDVDDDAANYNGITFIQCLYYAIITTTTIGYGDFSPKTDGGMVVGVIYILVSVTAVGNVLGNIAGAIIGQQQKAAMDKILSKKITLADFEKFDIDGDGQIEKTEFVVRKLMLMGILSAEDVLRVEEEFETMDTDGSGEITLEDLGEFLKKKEAAKQIEADAPKGNKPLPV